jgi:predicted outer membrane repeat protein
MHLAMIVGVVGMSIRGEVHADVINVPADQPTIQGAIIVANPADEVVVAPGTYSEIIDLLGKAITVRSSGGAVVTTIDASAVVDPGNGKPVVRCDSGEGPDTVLDGFTITGGTGHLDSVTSQGLRVTDGGGMYNKGSPTVTNCRFSGNTATRRGGAVYNGFNSSPTFTQCTFNENFAVQGGGGMYNRAKSSPSLTDCTFVGNNAQFNGGGMLNFISSATVSNCKFIDNVAGTGGGVHNGGGAHPTFTNCVWRGNAANVKGGGMFSVGTAPTLTNCQFNGNTAGDHGAGMANYEGSPMIANCTFRGNVAAKIGGGIYFRDGSAPQVTNSIFWGNLPNQLWRLSTSVDLSVRFTDIEGGWAGDGNIDVDPLFVDADGPDNVVGTEDDDLRLQPTSQCIDAGTTADVIELTDLDGNQRITNCSVDMGAYEDQSDAPLLVQNITQGTSFCGIQEGIDAAVAGDVIEAAPRTYAESINFLSKAIEVRSASGDPTDTIIDGSGDSHVVQFVNGETASAVLEGFTITGGHANGISPDQRGAGIFCNDASPSIINCIISGNRADFGAGMLNQAASNPTITRCIFRDNSAVVDGGGLYNNFDSSPTITHCTFTNNSSDVNGAGMYNNFNSSPTITRCTFTANMPGADGGGIYNNNCSATISDCIFSGHTANSGGGLYNVNGSNPDITNCIFSGNVANFNGGAMVNNVNCNPTLVNCTFSSNTANLGGGMFNDSSSPATHNSIFWNNSDSGGMDESAQMHTISGTPVVNDSNFMAGWTGLGGNNINTDPFFVDADGADRTTGTSDDDLRLQGGSDCIDAGNNSVVPIAITSDLDGHARVLCDQVDMGAYEFAGDFDCDRFVDLLDFANWDTCMTGPDGGPYEIDCTPFDFDADLDIDMRDFAEIGIVFSP